jgi:chromate transporter
MPHSENVPAHGVSFGEATKVWARIAALSFGGPAGQIAVMHRILVEEKRWVGEPALLGCAALGVVIYQAGFA